MVLKQRGPYLWQTKRFENDVKMYGTQTPNFGYIRNIVFENDVKMYGTQTQHSWSAARRSFENDVKMYGTQTLSVLWIKRK